MRKQRHWTSASLLRPSDPHSAEVRHRFAASAVRFYTEGMWLPPPMLFDAWVCQFAAPMRRRVSQEFHGAGYEAWLQDWLRIAQERLRAGFAGHDGDGCLPAFVLAHAIEPALGADRPRGPTDAATLERWASGWVADCTAHKEPFHGINRRCYEFFEEQRLRLDRLPARRMEALALAEHDLAIHLADRTSFSLTEKARKLVARSIAAEPPVSLHPGYEAARFVRAERGMFLERAAGRLPSNPARLSPIEFLYRKVVPKLFAYRVAENQLMRSFGQRKVRDRRKPRLGVTVLVREDARWHRAVPGAPMGLISTLRATLLEVLVRFQLALADLGWDLSVRFAWRGTAGPDVWTASRFWSYRLLAAGRQNRDILIDGLREAFPVFGLPVHRVPHGRVDPADTLDQEVRLHCASGLAPPDPFRPAPERIDLWLRPSRHGYVDWGEEARGGPGVGPNSAEFGPASRALVEAALTGCVAGHGAAGEADLT